MRNASGSKVPIAPNQLAKHDMTGNLFLFRRRSNHAFVEIATSLSASNRFKAMVAAGSETFIHRATTAAVTVSPAATSSAIAFR